MISDLISWLADFGKFCIKVGLAQIVLGILFLLLMVGGAVVLAFI